MVYIETAGRVPAEREVSIMKKRQYGTYTKDPVTGNKKRPILTLEQMNKRFDLIYGAVKASEANGTPMRHRWLMPGLARWAMKLERGLCR